MEIFSNQSLTLWKKQADEIFSALTKAVKMTPCGEDLGVGIACVPKTMKEHGILGLRVVRWCRDWGTEGQPFVPFKDYEKLSVCTTSVHDSSTIRQWWEEEKDSVKAFIKAVDTIPIKETLEQKELSEESSFSPKIAQMVLKESAKAKSLWFIPPLQDFLYMNKDYWLEKAEQERINIPGTVNSFNLTYRLSVSLEDLNKDKELIEKIQTIAER